MTMRFASSTLRTVNGVNSVGLAMGLTRDLVEERLEQSPLEHAARSAYDRRTLALADNRRHRVRHCGNGDWPCSSRDTTDVVTATESACRPVGGAPQSTMVLTGAEPAVPRAVNVSATLWSEIWVASMTRPRRIRRWQRGPCAVEPYRQRLANHSARSSCSAPRSDKKPPL